MSLRTALQGTVARCAPQEMQHATSTPDHATEHATTVQQPSCTGPQFQPEAEAPKLHELRELHGPSTYEGPRERQAAGAKVARCTHQRMQHATTAPADATADATPVQQGSCTPVATRPRIRQRSCTDCRHLSRVKTCTAPVAAGLLPTFGIVWPPAAHAASCAAFSGKVPVQAQERPYRLMPAQGDAAHADAWDDAAIARFQARVQRLVRLGFDADDADDLAEGLHLRDVRADYRHPCLECSHYRPGRCGNHRAAGLRSPELARDLASMLQRCAGFAS